MKVLVIRFSSIGDIVLTSPVLRCLKLQKDAEIHFLTKQAFTSVVSASPHIKRVHGIESRVVEVIDDLKAENFDLIIDLHKNLRSREVCWRLGKKSVSFHKANLEKWLMVRFKPAGMKVEHIVHRYMESLKSLDIEYDGAGLDYFLQPDGPELPKVQSAYICFGIGGTHYTKRMPVKKIREICQDIAAPVFLLGGKEDFKAGEEISGGLSQVHNYCGKLSISDSARMVKDAAVVLTHDTAIMHIAAAFNRRIFSIWGNTVPQFGMFPFYPDRDSNRFSIAQVDDLSCRPCSKIGYRACPKGHFKCMLDQNTMHIAELVRIELSNI